MTGKAEQQARGQDLANGSYFSNIYLSVDFMYLVQLLPLRDTFYSPSNLNKAALN